MPTFRITPISQEYADADFGDLRLGRRLVSIAETMGAGPAVSFPAASNDAELEGSYRFFRNDRVTLEDILAPHQRQTVLRARACRSIVVAHDTTEFNFGNKSSRRDLGRVGLGMSFGFYGHFALAIEDDEERTPLGVIGLHVHRRVGGKGRRGHKALQSAPDNEFQKWPKVITEVHERLEHVSAVHVMDREADSYAFMDELMSTDVRFVIRMAQATRKVTGKESVGDVLLRCETIAEREVPISLRGRSSMPGYRKAYPPRDARTAKLQITGTRVTLLRPSSSNTSPSRMIGINVVRVIETHPPEGEVAIEWRLWTSEPVETAEQVLAVVDWYRARWRIEEYFKVLKTGCAIEQRQLETHHSLVNVVGMYCAIAWRLLVLRVVARRRQPGGPDVLTPRLRKLLRAALLKKKRPPLPSHPTARDVMLGVAALGGHIKHNGDPGWQVLGRGLDLLLTIEVGYSLAVDEDDL